MLGNDYNKPCNERSFRSVLAATPNGKNQYLNSFKSFQLQNCNIDCRDTETMECHETLELHFFICWFVVSSSEQWRCDNHSSTPTECLRRRSKKWTTNRIHSSIFVVFIVVEIECFNRKVFVVELWIHHYRRPTYHRARTANVAIRTAELGV